MKSIHFWLGTGTLFLFSLYLTKLQEPAMAQDFPYLVSGAVGRVFGGFFLGAILWAVVRLANRDNPPDPKKYLFVTAAIAIALNYFVVLVE